MGKRNQNEGGAILTLIGIGIVLWILSSIGELFIGANTSDDDKLKAGIAVAIVLATVGLGVWFYLDHMRQSKEREVWKKIQSIQERAHEALGKLVGLIHENFDAKVCPKCQEYEWKIINLSPNAKSIEAECTHCSKKARIKAISQDTKNVKKAWKELLEFDNEAMAIARTVDQQIEPVRTFQSIPTASSKKSREPIPDHVRRAVYKRDRGKCVKCGSTDELQFDHIIPFSKGGATTIENLQILCKSCNLEKGASI